MRHYIALLIFILSVSASAQELLTMDKAVDIALQHNHSLLGSFQDVESAKWGKLNAVTNFLPKVTVSSGVTQIDNETLARSNAAVDFIKAAGTQFGIPPQYLVNIKPFAYHNTYATSITVVQPIYNGGAEAVGYKAADATEEKSEYSLEDTRQDVIARVRVAYFTVLKAQEFTALSKESASRTQRYLEMTQRRVTLGLRTETDVLRWQVQLASDEGNVISAENFLAMAKLQLNDAMGIAPHTEFTFQKISDSTAVSSGGMPVASVQADPPAGPDEDRDASRQITFDQLAETPSFKIMDANLRLASVNIDKSWIAFQPRANLAFQYGWEQNNTVALDGIRPWAISFSLSFPIFNSFGDYTNLEKARADYARAQEQVESFKSGLLLQAINAQLTVNAAQQRIETARKGTGQAQEVLNAVTRRYESGSASNIDVIDVQTAYTSAKTNYITALYDYYIAEVQLDRALGRVSQ
ncbi:MAG: TolC family protein [Bacteroidota bacterium]|nr:TolC family protein [Bacteroidota bacterium]